jgi:cytochrome P450
MFNMGPPDHTRLRRLVSKAFTLRSVEQLRPRAAATADELVETMLSEGEPADLVTGLARPLPTVVISDMLGVPTDERAVLYEWIDAIVSVTPVTPDVLAHVNNQAGEYLIGLIDHRRGQPGDDLLTALVQVHDHGDRLTQQEMAAEDQPLVRERYGRPPIASLPSSPTVHIRPSNAVD